jgi:UDPglucose--hexose-1-phosphate uridylyltransferase
MENELRKDYFLDRQVIIAVGRGRRPTDFKHGGAAESEAGKACFFCPGSENLTPPEIMRTEEGGRWVMRVFPNKFPAVTPEEGAATESMMPAYGRHEIVVESPEHDKTVADLSVEKIVALLGLYAKRAEALLADPKTKYVLIFKNHGKVAGASLSHTHTQIVSLPVVPKLVRDEADSAGKYAKEKGSCPLCDAWRKEAKGPRLVWEDEYAVVFTPYASRCPLEAWVMPKRHVRGLGELSDEERSGMAKGLKLILSKLKTGLGDAPYNLYFHVSPAGGDLHMHVEVLPRLAIFAGFELGSDIIINTMAPEAAADFYRA